MLHLSPAITAYCCLLALLLGACAGSFLNCAASRRVHGRSALRGRCRYCGAKLSSRHLWAELSSALTFLLLLLRYDISLQMLQALLLACVLLACAFADLEGYIIPDRYILTGIILRLPFFFLLPDPKGQLLSAALGGFAVGGGLLLVVLLYEKLRRVDAMGGGDLKLLFLTGLYLGWLENLLCLLLACLIGIITALAAQKRRRQQAPRLIPWGPSIAAAAILTLLFGDAVTSAYLSLF